jgi:hypothetical protein
MKPRIAISAPMTVPMVHLCEVEDLLNVTYKIPYSHISLWDRKSQYDQKAFDSADVVVFVLNDYAFEAKEGSVPIDVDAELRQVHKQGKHAFLAYKLKTTGEIKFYTIRFGLGPDYRKTFIKAVSDTTQVLGEVVRDFTTQLPDEDAKGTKQEFFIDQNEREAELENFRQEQLEEAAIRLIQNSMYGSFGELDHPSEQMKFPDVRRVYASLIPNPDYSDERLLLML